MAAATHPEGPGRVVPLRPGQMAGPVPIPPVDGATAADLVSRLVQALGSATAAYVDLAVAFGYGFPDDLVDGWLAVLVDAGVNPVDVLGWAVDCLDLPPRLVRPETTTGP